MSIARDSLGEDTLLALTEKLKAWDENFRVLTDISSRLIKLEEDVRVSRQTNETETPVPSPITLRETRLTDNYQPIKLKDAIESVPVFDGYRPCVFQFLRSCERA
jgi:hypothetical protein